jgi:hypothetical protein
MLQRPLLRLLAVQVIGGPLRVTGGRVARPPEIPGQVLAVLAVLAVLGPGVNS